MSVNAYLTANTLSAYTARSERLDGVDYLVAPAVLLVEGVHHGSAGPVFYPLNELSAFPGSWDGRPVTLGHPEIGGQPISASSPDAIPLFSLGTLLNTVYDPQLGGLRSEVWLDINKARRIAPDVLSAMRNGEPLEISTGLWYEAQGEGGVWGNEEFSTTATRFRPDHLALLPGQVGACSISDGCGLRANKKKGGKMHHENVRTMARRPSFSGTESTGWSAPDWADVINGYNRARGTNVETGVSVSDAPQALKNWAARLSLLGDERADNFRDLVFFPVVNPTNRNLSERALRAVIGGRGSQAQIPVRARESSQTLARRLLNSEFDAGLEVQNKGMSDLFDRFIKFVKNQDPSKEEMVEVLIQGFTINKPGMVSTARALQTELDAMDRETPNGMLLHFLEDAFDDGSFVMRQTGGAEGTKFFMGSFSVSEDEQVEVANDFSEVREKREFVDVSNAADTGASIDTLNESKEENNVSDKKKTLVDNLIGCGKTVFNEDHRAGLMAMDDAALEQLKANDVQNQAAPAAPASVPASNEQARPKTLEETVAGLPEEHQGPIKDAIAANDTRKKEAVKNILDAPGNTFAEADLMAKNLTEVEAIEALVKGNKEEEEEGGMGNGPDGNAGQADFSGKGAVSTSPTGNQGDSSKPLGRPV
jgi:hypothetical protein